MGIVLILIVLILGVISSSVENTTEKIIKTQENDNMEKLTAEVVDNLINNPGFPDNWHEYEKGTPGLAIVNDEGQVIPNSVSYAKLMVLGKNYDKLVSEKLFDSKIQTSMELIPQKSSVSSVKIGCGGESNSIFSVNRLVKCDFHKSYALKDFQNEGKCNDDHSQKEHSCNYFKAFPGNLKNSDYYLLIDESEVHDLKYYIDTTTQKDSYWQAATNKIYLNNEIDFYNESSAIVFIHLDKPKAKALLVCVPKDFDRNNLQYDYFTTNECQFILKAWY